MPFDKRQIFSFISIANWLKKPGMSGSPSGLTWHHNRDVFGKLQLVDCLDHRSNHRLYHQDGTGGREKWGGGKACR